MDILHSQKSKKISLTSFNLQHERQHSMNCSDINLRSKLSPTILLILGCLMAASMPSQGNDQRCAPYLVDKAELTRILIDNIRNTPLYNPRVETTANGQCQIRLLAQATIPVLNQTVDIRGCTKPIHSTNSIGLSAIRISNPIQLSIPAGSTDVSDKIRKHCGKLYPIQAVHTTNEGVLLLF